MRKFILSVCLLLILFRFDSNLSAQTLRLSVDAGYVNTKWTDVTNFDKLQTSNNSGLVISANLSYLEVIKNRLFFGTGLRFAQRGSTITGPYYLDLNRDYTHYVTYSALDIPIFYEYRQPIKKYRYHYNNSVYDKIALSARVGTDISFLASSTTFIHYKGGEIVESGKAITNYSPRINDLFHHICLSLGGEYYFDNKFGVNLTFGLDRSRALTKAINHPFFNKSIYYKPVDARFAEQAISIKAGGIYRF